MGISNSDYHMMLSRLEKQQKVRPDLKEIDDAIDEENKLQGEIIKFLNERQWYFVWSPMWMRTSTKRGTPDFVIAAPGGRTLWIECKSRTGKSSDAQKGAAKVLTAQDHEHYVVRSYRQFCNAVNNTKANAEGLKRRQEAGS